MAEFNNGSEYNFVDISMEVERIYTFPTGQTYWVGHPKYLHVSENGGHRIFDGNFCHYIQAKEGWAIRWQVEEGEFHFVV